MRYNYMFRPCKWTIIRLFTELVGRLHTRGWRIFGGRDLGLLPYALRPPISYSSHWLYILRTRNTSTALCGKHVVTNFAKIVQGICELCL